MDWLDDGVYPAMLRRGISRRSFIKFTAAMAATLALPATYGARIAAAVETAPRIPLIWLRGQSCGGDGQAFLQASDPTIGQMLIELLSVDYSDALMAPSGAAAERSRTDALAVLPARYIAVVEGSHPDGCGRDLVPHRRACLQRRRPRGVRGRRGDDRRRLVRVRWRGERGARGHDVGLRGRRLRACRPAGQSARAARSTATTWRRRSSTT